VSVAVLALAILAASVAYSLTGALLVRKFVRPYVSGGHNEVLLTICQIAGTIYAVLLGFLVVVVWQSYDGAHTNLAAEASLLTTLYRQTDGMPLSERAPLRTAIRAYTRDVIDDEWAVQSASGAASPQARRALADMYRTFGTLRRGTTGAALDGDFLSNLSAVAQDRNTRTLRANEQLPWILWGGLTLGGAIVVFLTFLPRMEREWLHVLACTMLAALIGTLLSIAVVLNRPFSGPMALEALPFQHSLQVFDSVDRGS
jgi:hypothetical protein